MARLVLSLAERFPEDGARGEVFSRAVRALFAYLHVLRAAAAAAAVVVDF